MAVVSTHYQGFTTGGPFEEIRIGFGVLTIGSCAAMNVAEIVGDDRHKDE